MSDRYSIRSHLVPGAAFVTGAAGTGVPTTAPLGFDRLTVEFALMVGGAPVVLASDSEPHWIFSFHDKYTISEILAIGITPGGAVVVSCIDIGDQVMTDHGAVQPNDAWHSATLTWDWPVNGILTLDLDGDEYTASLGAGGSTPAPTSDGEFCLLNGQNALSRFGVSVRRASARYGTAHAGPMQTVSWELAEGPGDTSAPAFSGDPGYLEGYDLTMHRKWLDGSANPWPVDFSGSPREAIDWRLKTPYTRRTRAKTKYTRRRASWLS